MIDNEGLRKAVVSGLHKYLNIPVIRGNQNAAPPTYPYLSYNVTTLESANNGTWGKYEDGIDRIPITQTWSITVQSDSDAESISLASKAREFLCHTGTHYLNDNGVIVKSVTNITNRDSLISVDYEYKNGFDAVFWLMNEEKNPIEEIGYIETIKLKEDK
jgi:hypothetical protein